MVKNNDDDLMSDNLDVICSLAEVASVLDIPDDCKNIELDNCIDNSERLKELDQYLTALEDIGNLSENGCSTTVSFFFFLSFKYYHFYFNLLYRLESSVQLLNKVFKVDF